MKKYSILKRMILIGALVSGLVIALSFFGTTNSPVNESVTTEETTLSPEEEANALKESIIPIATLKDVLETLTSERYEGRFPGTEGNLAAAQLIRDKMVLSELIAPSFTEDFYMSFEMRVPSKKSKTTMKLTNGENQIEFSFGEDFVEYVGRDFAKGVGTYEGEFVIIDNSLELYNFESLGYPEIVVYTEKAIADSSYETLFAGILATKVPPKVVLYENSQQNSGHFIISPSSRMVSQNDNENGLLIYKISPNTAEILKQKSDGILSMSTNVIIEQIEVPNVIGMIDGTGDEGFIVSAHFDHLGNNFDGSYNPGALDNASGVAVMLSLANAINVAADPTLDFYFIAFNGEEEGLYGSEAFAMSDALEPSKIKVINIDMVGASQAIPVEVSSTAIQSIPLQDAMLSFALESEIEALSSSKGSSDHVPLESVGFQVVSLTEFDQRFYHTPSDTVENSIDFIEMQNIATFIYNFVFE